MANTHQNIGPTSDQNPLILCKPRSSKRKIIPGFRLPNEGFEPYFDVHPEVHELTEKTVECQTLSDQNRQTVEFMLTTGATEAVSPPHCSRCTRASGKE